MAKKKINIVIASNGSQAYIDFLNKRFDVTILDVQQTEIKPDLILFTGGADVSPSIYGESVGKFTSVNNRRDKIEQDMYYRFRNIPKLGICRGSQFLTAMSGGKLIQHVTGHAIGTTHRISVNAEKLGMRDYRYDITSTHHQMMYPYNLHADKFELIGYSYMFESLEYLNGKNENIEVIPEFLEPEIVYYNKTKALAIQGHPEFKSCPNDTVELCLALIEEYLLK